MSQSERPGGLVASQRDKYKTAPGMALTMKKGKDKDKGTDLQQSSFGMSQCADC